MTKWQRESGRAAGTKSPRPTWAWWFRNNKIDKILRNISVTGGWKAAACAAEVFIISWKLPPGRENIAGVRFLGASGGRDVTVCVCMQKVGVSGPKTFSAGGPGVALNKFVINKAGEETRCAGISSWSGNKRCEKFREILSPTSHRWHLRPFYTNNFIGKIEWNTNGSLRKS